MVKKAYLQVVEMSERLAHAYIKIGESCPRLDVSGMTVNKQHTTRNKQHTTHNTQQSTWLRTYTRALVMPLIPVCQPTASRMCPVTVPAQKTESLVGNQSKLGWLLSWLRPCGLHLLQLRPEVKPEKPKVEPQLMEVKAERPGVEAARLEVQQVEPARA